MKKIISILLFVFAFNAVMAQVTPGRYLIKLALNHRAIQANSYNAPLLEDACPDYNNNCQNQIWDIQPVVGQMGLYSIQSVLNRKFLTFREGGTVNQVNEDLLLEPQKSGTQLRFQSFYIADAGDGKITIKPQRISAELNNNNLVYLSGDLKNLNSPGSMIKFEYKDERWNPRDFNNLTDVYFTLFAIPTITNVSVANTQIKDVIGNGSTKVAIKSENKIDIDFKTGSDNLEVKDVQENLEIRLIIQNKADVILLDANKNQNWPNNSVRRVSIPLPADVKVDEIKEIHLIREAKGGSRDNFKATIADNWNLESINATATIKTNGVQKKYEFEKIVSPEYGRPLFRFVYERGNDVTDGTFYKSALTLKSNALPPAVNTNVSAQNAKLEISIGTGGDDLRGGNDNCNIVLTFKSNTKKIQLTNVFNGRSLGGFTEKNLSKDIPNSQNIDINDIKEVEIHHTGGGGIGADNWDIDKVKITIIKDGQTKILVDKVGAPIHRFDGDFRIKRFTVE